jgi:hypothetical protein
LPFGTKTLPPSRIADDEVLCTNPANLAGGSGALTPYYLAHAGGLFNIAGTANVKTVWVTYPNLDTAQCVNSGGADVLKVTDIRKAGDTRPMLRDSLGETWGLHLYDGNIALGNLVNIVKAEADAYTASH